MTPRVRELLDDLDRRCVCGGEKVRTVASFGDDDTPVFDMSPCNAGIHKTVAALAAAVA